VVKWGTGWSNNRLREQISITDRWELLLPLLEEEGRDSTEIDMHTEATLFLAPTHDQAIKRFRNGWQGVDFNRVIDRGLIGTPAEIVDKISLMQQDGLTHILGIPGQITFFEEWLEQVQIFGEEVLPNFA
jgi:alkanesulfonate monooxygenase SsuD/methylene tetrahydromethanopterin reductase-like flavin-dependent oxidoreductase (luciferase family)